MRIREGVTAGVNEKMEAVQADVVAEDGLLLRVCEHGVRHPVGHLHRAFIRDKERAKRHYVPGVPSPCIRPCGCDCQCCEPWLNEVAARATA